MLLPAELQPEMRWNGKTTDGTVSKLSCHEVNESRRLVHGNGSSWRVVSEEDSSMVYESALGMFEHCNMSHRRAKGTQIWRAKPVRWRDLPCTHTCYPRALSRRRLYRLLLSASCDCRRTTAATASICEVQLRSIWDAICLREDDYSSTQQGDHR